MSKSAGGAATYFQVPFNNAAGGVIDLRDSSMTLEGGGASTGGTIKFAGGAILDLTGNTGSNVLTGTYTATVGSGGGEVQLNNGTLNIGAAGATFNFPSGLFQWNGGTISGGTLTNPSTSFITIGTNNAVVLDSATLTNNGTVTDSGGGFLDLNDGAVVNNQTGAIFEFPNAAAVGVNVVRTTTGAAGTFNNAGTVIKPGGNAPTSIQVPFNNSGTAESDLNVLSITGTVNQVAGTTLTRRHVGRRRRHALHPQRRRHYHQQRHDPSRRGRVHLHKLEQ